MRFPIKIGLPGSNKQLWMGMKNGLIRDVISGSWWWRQRIRLRDLTMPGATNGTFLFGTVYPNNPFPERVIRKHALLYVNESLEGGSISAGTFQAGDTGDPDGIFTAAVGDIFDNDNATIESLAAAEASYRYEGDYNSDGFGFRLDSTGANLSAATALDLTFMVEFAPTLYVP